MTLQRNRAPLAICVFAAMLSAGCTALKTGLQAGPSEDVPVSASASLNKIALMIDKTGSASTAKFRQPSVDDLGEILQWLRDTGGELGVGLIRDESDRPMLRVRFDPPPPATPLPGNVFLREREVALRKAADSARRQVNDKRLDSFRHRLQELLAVPASARRSDILGAVKRGDLFLAEPEREWRKPVRHVLVLVTDGIDNVRKTPTALRSQASVLLVNGADSIGVLAFLHPIQFENLQAAANFIVHQEGGKDAI